MQHRQGKQFTELISIQDKKDNIFSQMYRCESVM